MAILGTYTPLLIIQVHSPFHRRVQPGIFRVQGTDEATEMSRAKSRECKEEAWVKAPFSMTRHEFPLLKMDGL